MFDLKGKVAIVTGGASGIGFCCSKELLRNGLKAVTIADINHVQAQIAVQEIESTFGAGRVKFVKTDVGDKGQFEEAFKETIKAFGNVDIVINNAGIFDDFKWEKMILTNLNGTINGTILAIESYLPKYRSGSEAVVVNISSITGLDQFGSVPIYAATKHGILGLGQAFGLEVHYNRTKVKVLTVCPGITNSPLIIEESKGLKFVGPDYYNLVDEDFGCLTVQSPEFLAKAMVQIIQKGKTGSVWVVECEQPAYEVYTSKRQLRIKAASKI